MRRNAAEPRLEPDRVSFVMVGADGAGQRLDNFLLRLARGVPKSHIYRVVRSGEVRVNRARARADQRLAEGDELRIPPMRLGVVPAAPPPPRGEVPPVLYEDEYLLAVDKPAGLAAHGGSGIAHGLIERVRAARPHQPFLELAHRLDRETSGILLLAKSRRALVALHAMLREGQVDKRYLVLVKGDWVNDRQHVRLPLAKFVTRAGERRVAVSEDDGQSSHTVFNLQARLRSAAGDFSLLQAELKTGRTHQIRVHLAHLGFPIVGDDKYGDFELNRRAARGHFGARLGRMFLHAARTTLAHPVSGEPLDLQSALPRECDDFVRELARAAAL
ncbi:MAG: RluA family pseudouridine synthase [Burkholderiales bacterium]|jgi:23S rRNA pseudouridine955/2504/2580 synthase|nr:RluA family pseudouridine synthase [Burkholderiales bacterium]